MVYYFKALSGLSLLHINALSKSLVSGHRKISSVASSIILPADYSLENLRPVGGIPGFYCPPAQWTPASAIARRSCLTAGSEFATRVIAKEMLSYRQDCSYKYDLRCLISPA